MQGGLNPKQTCQIVNAMKIYGNSSDLEVQSFENHQRFLFDPCVASPAGAQNDKFRLDVDDYLVILYFLPELVTSSYFVFVFQCFFIVLKKLGGKYTR